MEGIKKARLRVGLVAAAIALGVTAALPCGAAAAPKAGLYTATAPGDSAVSTLTIKVLIKHRTPRARLLEVGDDCGASFSVFPPVGLGLSSGAFRGAWTGSTNTTSSQVMIDGFFVGRSRATATVQSSLSSRAQPAFGVPASFCSDVTSFDLVRQVPSNR